MAKADFIDQLAKRADMSKKDARQTLDTALELITSEVKKNGLVRTFAAELKRPKNAPPPEVEGDGSESR